MTFRFVVCILYCFPCPHMHDMRGRLRWLAGSGKKKADTRQPGRHKVGDAMSGTDRLVPGCMLIRWAGGGSAVRVLPTWTPHPTACTRNLARWGLMVTIHVMLPSGHCSGVVRTKRLRMRLVKGCTAALLILRECRASDGEDAVIIDGLPVCPMPVPGSGCGCPSDGSSFFDGARDAQGAE